VSEYQLGPGERIVNGYLLRETSGGKCLLMVTEGYLWNPEFPDADPAGYWSTQSVKEAEDRAMAYPAIRKPL
jgi:hypothetical protein